MVRPIPRRGVVVQPLTEAALGQLGWVALTPAVNPSSPLYLMFNPVEYSRFCGCAFTQLYRPGSSEESLSSTLAR